MARGQSSFRTYAPESTGLRRRRVRPRNNAFTISGWCGSGSIAGGGGSDSLAVTKDASFVLSNTSIAASDGLAMTLSGVSSATLTGGASNNTFDVSGWTGKGAIVGGGGVDTIAATKDANFSLFYGGLSTTDGMSVSLSAIASAALAGGPSNNTFSVSGWSGTGSISGGGVDSIVSTKDANVTLTNSSIAASDGLSMTLSGIASAGLTGGASSNTFTVSGWTGKGSVNGGGGSDTIVATKDAGFTLTNGALTTTDGMSLTLSAVAAANLAGGPSNNTFTVGGWTGSGSIAGGGGSDTVAATKDASFTLANASLSTSDGMSLSLSGIASAGLTGGASNNTFTVGGWTGSGSIVGGGGADTIAATKDANFSLFYGGLSTTDGMGLTLSAIASANLTGGPSNNTFSVSGWSGTGSISGGGGTDSIVSTKDANVALANASIVAGDGMSLALSGIASAGLTGGPSNNTFTVSGWTGKGNVNGGGGSDTVVATKDAGFTLTNGALTTTDGMSLTLSGISSAGLTGGPSANAFTVSGWTGSGSIAGGGGADSIVVTKNANVVLANTAITTSDGMSLTLSGIGTANLTGAPATTPSTSPAGPARARSSAAAAPTRSPRPRTPTSRSSTAASPPPTA